MVIQFQYLALSSGETAVPASHGAVSLALRASGVAVGGFCRSVHAGVATIEFSILTKYHLKTESQTTLTS